MSFFTILIKISLNILKFALQEWLEAIEISYL